MDWAQEGRGVAVLLASQFAQVLYFFFYPIVMPSAGEIRLQSGEKGGDKYAFYGNRIPAPHLLLDMQKTQTS